MFEVGKVYKRKEEIHIPYGGQRQGGISTPANKPYVFIFTSDAGHAYGYADEFRPDGTFWYTGEGQTGDMRMESGNLALKNHAEAGKTIHLFEYVKKAYVRYLGTATYLDHHLEQRPDINDNLRDAIIFELAIDNKQDAEQIQQAPVQDLKALRKKSLSELRIAALANTNKKASKREIKTVTAIRSEAIKLYALARAKGICEGCGNNAPFESKKGPFLEVHHVYRLGDGGPDHPENVIALCPNCHKHVHYGKDGGQYNQELIKKLGIIENI